MEIYNSCRTKFQFVKKVRIISIATSLLVLGFSQNTHAEQSPPGCNASTLNLTLSRSVGTAVPGQIVNFGVSVSVAPDLNGVPACDTKNVTITAQCPDSSNNIPPTTPVQTLAINQSYPAGTPPTSVGSIDCVMPDVPANKAISAYAKADGLLLDTDALEGSPLTAGKSITVIVTPCQVKIDKQVSCDNGNSWIDEGLVLNNEDGTLDCKVVGLDNPVMVRYQAQNTSASCPLTACQIQESNPSFSDPYVGNIAPGATTDFFSGGSAACSTAYGNPENPNEPNTATITCQTGGTPVTASDLAAFSCLKVDAKVDRAVDCGDGFQDATLVRNNEDGTNGCNAVDGEPVNWKYAACNIGTAKLYDCKLVDQNLLVSDPIHVGDLAAGACVENIPNSKGPVLCSDALESSEAHPNGKVDLICCDKDVAGIEDCQPANRVTVNDISTVTCSTPVELNITKECVDTNLDGTADNVRVKVSAGEGAVGFVNCVATDSLYRDGACPATGTADDVALTPEGGVASPFSLAAGSDQYLFGTIDPALQNKACNLASVTCTVEGTDQLVTANAPPVTCEFEEKQGCLTRTPGFWGNRPNVTSKYLDIEVCGKTIDNVTAGNGHSAIEAMCSVGKDSKIMGPQLTQLVRQCTAAALNIAASSEEGGDCRADDRNIGQVFDACCSAESACTGDTSEMSISSCISQLDAFNNSLDTMNPEAFQKLGPADSSVCQASKNNGVVVKP